MADVLRDHRRKEVRRSKRTPRIIVAYSFLKNISLDGKANRHHVSGSELRKDTNSSGVTIEDDEEVSSLLAELEKPQNNHVRSLHQSVSVTCTHDIEKDVKAGKICAQRLEDLSKESVKDLGRTKSLVETCSSRRESSKLTYLASPTLFRQSERYLSSRRIVLVTSQHQVPCGIFSVVPYNRELKGVVSDGSKSQGTTSSSLKIEGIEIGEGKKVVSYSHLLIPRWRTHMESLTSEEAEDETFGGISPRTDTGELLLETTGYSPLVLDDPELISGKHRTVLQLPSLMLSVFQYAKPSEIKRDINLRFQERFPNVHITLTKLRSIKKEMTEIGMKCSLDLGTVACAHVYFEKLVLMGKINKVNRKYCAGACLLLSAKFNDDIRKAMINPLIETIAERFRLHLKELLSCELQVLVCLEFSLCLIASEVQPLFKRLDVT